MMDLFDELEGSPRNLLPHDGTVNYYGALMSANKANEHLAELLDKIEWKNDEVIIYGKRIVTKRKMAWYGDNAYEYTYSKTTKKALPWTENLQKLKVFVEQESGETFNSCLLNLYHNGTEGMTWHSDAEKELKNNSAIASLSFGAERKFSFKHKINKKTVSLILQNGSLLVMREDTQKYWLHALPTTKTTDLPRVNLTFRTIKEV